MGDKERASAFSAGAQSARSDVNLLGGDNEAGVNAAL